MRNVRDKKVDEFKELRDDELVEIINNHRENDLIRYEYLYNLYKGEHSDILDREVGENKPNNKLIADFYGKLVDTEIGYYTGQPVVFNVEQERASEELEKILVMNEFDELLMEVEKEASIKGKSYTMVYQDEDSITCLCRVSPDSLITLESNRGRGEIGLAIRYYSEWDEDDNEIVYVEIYDKNNIYYRVLSGNELAIDKEKGNSVGHIYGIVPIFVHKNNEEEMGSFEKIITLVNAYNKLLSDTSNEHEAYRNAYLVLKNMSADEEAQKRLKEDGILEIFDDGEAFFLQKPVLSQAIDSHLDRLSNDIHKFADTPDMSDEKFAGNLSGVAISFKLLGLENKCIIKERKSTRAIRRLLKALNVPILTLSGEEIDLVKVQIMFTRNIPQNIKEIADTISSLNGTVDKETLLGLLPFVDNPKAILEKLEGEQGSYENDMKSYEDKVMKSVEEMPVEEEEEEIVAPPFGEV